jgi:outer membrane lipoprotein
MNRVLLLILIGLLGGCAGQIPAIIKEAPAGNLSIAEARGDTTHFQGTTVRWGGVITRVENKPEETWVEVVSRELQSNGRPIADSNSGGRFIASFTGFVDPVVYAAGHQLTVVGTIQGETTLPIGDYTYTFPIVKVSTSYLWPEVKPTPYYEYPPPWWYYDPWPYYYHRRPYPYPPYR